MDLEVKVTLRRNHGPQRPRVPRGGSQDIRETGKIPSGGGSQDLEQIRTSKEKSQDFESKCEPKASRKGVNSLE